MEPVTGLFVLGTVIFAARGELKTLVKAPPAQPPAQPPAPAGHLAALQAFTDAHNGRALTWNVDHVNPYGAQCVNVVNGWCQAIGIETFPGDAGDFQYDAHPDCDWIANTPSNFPYPGDLVVWSRRGIPPAGHVAVALWGDANRFHSFDQNWPIGSLCHEQFHDYHGVAGWFHPRKLPRPLPEPAW